VIPRPAALGAALLLTACPGLTDSDSDADADGLTGLLTEALGTFDDVSDTGDYIELTVPVPEGAVSAMVHCGDWGDDRLGAVWTLSDQSGTKVFDGDDGDTSKFRSEFLDDRCPSVLPISPKLDIAAGDWTFNYFLGAGSSGSIDCGAVYRFDDVHSTGRITVELVFVGLDGLDAASAPSDAGLTAALDTFTSEWASGGLDVDFVYKDFAGNSTDFAVVDVTDEDSSELNDLLRTANPTNPRAITFFLVQEISNGSAGGATILGLSAGPPGAAATPKTSKSGVVVSAIDIGDTPEDVGKIMAHEGGHFLGLYHTSEKDGSQYDPLDDTPKCTDDGGDGTLNTDDCQGAGADNVMWWTLTQVDATLSGDQSWVVLRNPTVE
jgi:hypothetical protein